MTVLFVCLSSRYVQYCRRGNGNNLHFAFTPFLLRFANDYPAFSPDGKQLAFVRMNSDLGDIFIMSANGGEPRRLTFDHASIPTPPVWTRDGRSIVFSSTRSSVPT